MGDAFPDFDKMTLEEQMAWLESLAKRQGVKDEELTTKADLDIPIPEDVQVDEPGYVPFEGSASARKLKEAQESAVHAQPEPEAEPELEYEAEPQAEIEPEPEAEPEPEFEPQAAMELEPEIETELEAELDFLSDEEPAVESLWDSAEPIEEVELFAEADEVADPMLWLDSLSAQPESELEDLFADSEAFALEGGETAFEVEASELPAVSDEAEGAQAVAASDDPLGGMDPMLWLESLAKRQGANPDELVTLANLDVEEVDEGAVIDEPGYVPFEGSSSARRLKETQETEAGFEYALPELETGIEQPEAEAPSEQETFAYAEESAPVEDSMLWLESLAKRQGANPEELLTQADLDIPELPEDTVIDEPGYVEYSPFSILPDQEIEIPEPEHADQDTAAAALSWLEDLAAEPGEDLSEILAFGEDMFEPVEEETIEPEPTPAAALPTRDDPLAGMSDEEVAYAQAHGQLTGEQELAWLKRQAAKLAEVRESQEADREIEEEEEGEIAPGELPPWLLEMRDEVEQIDLEAPEQPIEIAELQAEAVDISEWLEEAPASADEEAAQLEIPDFDAAVLAEEDVASLWGETPESEIELEDIGLPDDSELAKFLAEGIVPEGADPLAEALDAEFDRKLTGDESEPEWYTDAVAKAAADISAMPETDVEPIIEEGIVEATVVDMPDWLNEVEGTGVPTDDEAMPGWLVDIGETEPSAELEEPAWLVESEPEFTPAAEHEDLPSWLRDLDKSPDEAAVFAEEMVQPVEAETFEPEPEPQAAVPTPPPSVPAAPPELEIRRPATVQPEVRGELLQKITQRLQQDPNDHATRLAFARALRDSQQTIPSLDQYEALIDTSQLLQDVSNDLTSLTEAHGNMPRVRRLLGDAYMRRGLLQDALSAYRSALEQL